MPTLVSNPQKVRVVVCSLICLKSSDTLDNALKELLELVPFFSGQIIVILSRRCSEGLGNVRSIPSQFRAMAHKRDVVEPSHFVPTIMRPVKAFFETPSGEALRADLGETWASEIFEGVASRQEKQKPISHNLPRVRRYTTHLITMKKTEDSLRRLTQGKKTAFSLFSGKAGRPGEDTKEDERIKAQIILDVEALAKDAASLGIAVDKSTAYLKLHETAASGLNVDG